VQVCGGHDGVRVKLHDETARQLSESRVVGPSGGSIVAPSTDTEKRKPDLSGRCANSRLSAIHPRRLLGGKRGPFDAHETTSHTAKQSKQSKQPCVCGGKQARL